MLDAAAAFDQFIAARGLKTLDVAEALKTSGCTVSEVRRGKRPPSALLQRAIERWTRGAIPADSWLTETDREVLAAVVPVRRPRKTAARTGATV